MSHRKIKYTIKDNFLDEVAFRKIEEGIIGGRGVFPWYYSPIVGAISHKNIYFSYFLHTFYENNMATSSKIKLIEPLINKLKIKRIIRAKVNLFYPTADVIKFDEHRDTTFESEAAILYINTCNGGTVIDGDTFIKSKRNRLLKFKGSVVHQSTSCSDAKFRILININYVRH